MMMPVYSAVSQYHNIVYTILLHNIMLPYHIIACRTGDLRLQGSAIQGNGRVEVCMDNVWGTICNHFWSSNDARVVCKQLGFSIIGKGYNTNY